MIRHTVVFRLVHPPGSTQEADFLQAIRKLSHIPKVKNFECLRQISPKNSYQFGLSMEFDTAPDYRAYSDHPDHTSFVENRWKGEVSDFMEIDYEPMA